MSGNFSARLQAIVEKLSADFRSSGQRDIDTILAAGVNSYSDLVALLQDSTSDIRIIACWALARLGNKRASAPLLEALHDQDVDVREAAARSLGELGSKRALRPLLTLLDEEHEVTVRLAAVYALGLLGDRRAMKLLTAILGDPDENPRAGMAAEALANLRDTRAVAPLIAALHDPTVEVRFWAAFALGELGTPQALPALEHLAATDTSILPGWWAVNEEATKAIQVIQERNDAAQRSD